MEGRVLAGRRAGGRGEGGQGGGGATDRSPDPVAGDVQRHFDAVVADFDSIYTGRKSKLAQWLDRTLRRDMFQRFDATVREIAPMGPVSVLDIGCGNGIYAVALARNGATVVGVDFSRPMIDLAVARAASADVAARCRFAVGDFRLLEFAQPFDCSIAIGVFDYLAEPAAFLEAMRKVTRRKLVATFPCRWTYRAPIRKVRLALHKCPVYFYSAGDVRRLFTSLGMHRLRIQKMGHIFLAVAQCD